MSDRDKYPSNPANRHPTPTLEQVMRIISEGSKHQRYAEEDLGWKRCKEFGFRGLKELSKSLMI